MFKKIQKKAVDTLKKTFFDFDSGFLMHNEKLPFYNENILQMYRRNNNKILMVIYLFIFLIIYYYIELHSELSFEFNDLS